MDHRLRTPALELRCWLTTTKLSGGKTVRTTVYISCDRGLAYNNEKKKIIKNTENFFFFLTYYDMILTNLNTGVHNTGEWSNKYLLTRE